MRLFGVLAAWTATLFLALPANAWNATGHRAVAAIAYSRLTPKVRARVDDLIRRHPDYATLLTQNAPADPEGRAREAFLAAAVWPDPIRGDARFYDDLRVDAVPTPLLPGFPDMKRHGNWHYIDIPFTPDGSRGEPAPKPNAVTELDRMLKAKPITPYDLPWIEHIVGDLHQPLHCVTEFLQTLPKGDAGGNFIFVEQPAGQPGLPLHALWDNAPGQDPSEAYVTRYAAEVTAEHPPPKKISRDRDDWVEEGVDLAKSDVYKFGFGTGTRERPLTLPQGYEENAKRLARQQIALAGYRLAEVLNRSLK